MATHLDDDHETVKSKFYPLYGKILNYWFPAADHYDVCQDWIIPDPSLHGSHDCEDYTIPFVIKHQQQPPLLLLDVAAPSDFHETWGRQAAIQQITYYLDEIGPTNQQAERLYAISMVGKMWRACYVAKGKGSKGRQPVKGITATQVAGI
ncbi:hypothetical protein V8E53_005156 [Lactarius tabidus]